MLIRRSTMPPRAAPPLPNKPAGVRQGSLAYQGTLQPMPAYRRFDLAGWAGSQLSDTTERH